MTPDDRHQTLRLEMFEVWEPGADFPLVVMSDPSAARDAMDDGDTLVRRAWVREGMQR